MSALFDMLDSIAPAATTRPPTVTLKKRTAADATFADVRFRVMCLLNDGSPFYFYGRRQNGTTPNGGVAGGVRFYGAYLDRGNSDVTAADFFLGGTMDLVLTWKRLVGDSMGQSGSAHGHESVTWNSTPVFTVDGETIDYGGAAIDTVWTGEIITCSFGYNVLFADDSAEGARIERTMRFSRDGAEITQTRTLLVDAFFGDSEYHGMATTQNTEFASPRTIFSKVAVDEVTTSSGEDLGAGLDYEYARTQGCAFYGNGHIAAVRLMGEVSTARQAQGVAGYLNDRSASDNLYKWYHIVTDGTTGGTAYPAGDSVTTVARWQVWAETPELVTALDAFAAGSYQTNVQTSAAVRDKMGTVMSAVTPDILSQRKFELYKARNNTSFTAWCEANPQRAFRLFTIRDTGDMSPPPITNGDFENVATEFEVIVAYPRDHRYGSQMALDLDDVIESDLRQFDRNIGTTGYASHSNNATVITRRTDRTIGEACVFATLILEVRYWRTL